MFELQDLYQEIILDHSKRPRNFRCPDVANRQAAGHNPLCGDRVTVYLEVEDGVVADVGFEGSGCAISTASASVMTELVKGKSEAEARAMFARFHDLVTGEEDSAERDGQDERIRRRAAIPHAGQVRDPVLAYPRRGPRRRGHGVNRMRRASPARRQEL